MFRWPLLLSGVFFFFSSRRRHTRCLSDWSSDVCSSDLSVAPWNSCWLRTSMTRGGRLARSEDRTSATVIVDSIPRLMTRTPFPVGTGAALETKRLWDRVSAKTRLEASDRKAGELYGVRDDITRL